jgi:PAS domain S-box-containing protein
MALSDPEGRVLAANPAYYVLYGYAPEEVLRQSFAVIFPEDQRASAEAQYREVFSAPAPTPAFEAVVRRRDGTERIVEARASFVDEAGSRVAMLSVVRDVTEEVEARRNAGRVAAERRAFLDSVSHDLKSPLAALRWQLHSLRLAVTRDGPPSPGALDATLAEIDEGALQLSRLVDELVEVAGDEGGVSPPLQLGPTDLVALARDAVARHQRLASSHRIALVAAAEALPGTWDATRLARVVDNLLSNAIKYSPEGSEIVLRVASWPQAASGIEALETHHLDGPVAASTENAPTLTGPPEVVLVVEDHGLGIPAQDLPHIFERFRRGSNLPPALGGTGVGLTSVKFIVEQHGGRVSVASREGHGTTVSAWLPLQPPAL